MRFKLDLKLNKNIFGNLIPISYQYELSAWIYNVIAKSNALYATWLHDNGFCDFNKRFKMFTFSNIFPRMKATGDRLIIRHDASYIFLSFLPEKSTEEFIIGVFLENEFTLGDYNSRVQFRVEGIEILPSPTFTGISTNMHESNRALLSTSTGHEFRTLSPICISTKRENDSIEYVSPENEGYGRMLINNLKEKYLAFYGKPFEGDESFEFELLSHAKSRLITIKANTPEMTKVKGFHFNFRLKADTTLMHLMYEAGLGEKNSIGFGMVEKA